VKAKYRIKNNITDWVSLFLKTTKNSNARINDNNILIPIAVSVEKTFFSGFVFCPEKKIIRAVNEISVNPPVRKSAFLRGTGDGEIPFMQRIIATISRL
jgi:hypothetical protein